MKHQIFDRYQNLVREWDDDTRTYRDVAAGTTRAYNASENAEADRRIAEEVAFANLNTLLDRAKQAIDTNKTYLGKTSPTAAENTAQIKALTRQVNALIRIVTKETSTLDGA